LQLKFVNSEIIKKNETIKKLATSLEEALKEKEEQKDMAKHLEAEVLTINLFLNHLMQVYFEKFIYLGL